MKMKYLAILASVIMMSLSAFSKVTIPFEVPSPMWKALVTPTSEGQMFSTKDLKTAEILIRTEGPEWDFYEWRAQSSKELDEGESTWALQPGDVLAQKSEDGSFMLEVELNTYPHGLFDGFTQYYGLEELEVGSITRKDLEEREDVICLPDNEGNMYAIWLGGTEEHFGWACTFYVGKLKDGYVVFPYECTVERNIESEHSGILNGKLGNCDISKFTMRDTQYILNHAERMEDDVYAVMYAIITNEGRRINWLETKLVGNDKSNTVTIEDNQIYTQVEQPAISRGYCRTPYRPCQENAVPVDCCRE